LPSLSWLEGGCLSGQERGDDSGWVRDLSVHSLPDILLLHGMVAGKEGEMKLISATFSGELVAGEVDGYG